MAIYMKTEMVTLSASNQTKPKERNFANWIDAGRPGARTTTEKSNINLYKTEFISPELTSPYVCASSNLPSLGSNYKIRGFLYTTNSISTIISSINNMQLNARKSD